MFVFIDDGLLRTVNATFVVKPGGGEEYIIIPVGRNATLECSAINASMLGWTIGGFDPSFHDSELSGFTLYQCGPMIASTGELTSTVTVNGAVRNDGIEICCQITAPPQQCCINLIIYGNYFLHSHTVINLCCIYTCIDRPSSLENITVQSISAGSINITWDAKSVAGVDQYYIVNFTGNMTSIRNPYFSLNQSIHDIQCGTTLLITAVNGAGESSPSTFVLPSLPDIGPITASLVHQVWKVDGELLVRVSFEVSL